MESASTKILFVETYSNILSSSGKQNNLFTPLEPISSGPNRMKWFARSRLFVQPWRRVGYCLGDWVYMIVESVFINEWPWSLSWRIYGSWVFLRSICRL